VSLGSPSLSCHPNRAFSVDATTLDLDPARMDALPWSDAFAAMKALEAGAIANPDEATSIMKQDTDYKATFLDESVPYTLKLLKPASGTKTGCIDVANWQSYGDWMSSNQLITSTPDASALATTDYMPYSCT